MDLKNKIYFEWSPFVIILTTIIALILFYCIYYSLRNYHNFTAIMSISIIALVLLYVATQIPVYLYYDVNTFKIKHLIGQTKIPINNIITLEKVDDNITAYSIRKFGSGGFGGYLGKFSNNQLGNYTMYATQMKNLVLIKTAKRQYIISCTDYNELINYYENVFCEMKN